MQRNSKCSVVQNKPKEYKDGPLNYLSPLTKQSNEYEPSFRKTAAMKVSQFAPSQSPILTRPRQHMKTEISRTPERANEERLNTSPNTKQVHKRSPLQDRNTNLPTHQRKDNTMLTQFYTINEEIPLKSTNYHSSIASQVFPSPKRNPLLYSQLHKQSNIERNRSKSENGNSLSKSRKKIQFTIFDQRQKSRPKKCQNIVCPVNIPVIQYSVPYRCNPRVTIDLFDQNTDKLTKIDSKSKIKIHSKQRKTVSLQKKFEVSKSLIKSFNEQQLQKRVENTLLKLQKYTFVVEFMQRRQILEKIQGYIMKKQPECKWHLLIVDEVFKKIRQQDKFQRIVSK